MATIKLITLKVAGDFPLATWREHGVDVERSCVHIIYV